MTLYLATPVRKSQRKNYYNFYNIEMKWDVNRVLSNLDPCIPKCFDTFQDNFLCDKHFSVSQFYESSYPIFYWMSFISNSPQS